MVLIIILLLAVLIGFFVFKNKSVKNIFQPEQKYYTIDDEFNAKRKERQDEIDKLLSKIGKNGLDDLTEKERKRLDELSRK
ncbi:rhomboid family protein [Chryseobacterium sp. KACC 21268]|nr:rhomboid family protein [Chryseobacterium sp. KACC 21268]